MRLRQVFRENRVAWFQDIVQVSHWEQFLRDEDNIDSANNSDLAVGSKTSFKYAFDCRCHTPFGSWRVCLERSKSKVNVLV